MRVITGSARGKRLAVLEGEAVRPTTDRVKEALFNIIQFQIEGRRVLDLFAGSGQLGIEALSRGASEAVFVDCAKESIAVITKNVENCGLAGQARIVQTDYASYLARRDGTFDLVFLDPPYRTAGKGSAARGRQDERRRHDRLRASGRRGTAGYRRGL